VSDTGEYWNALKPGMKADSKRRRQHNREHSKRLLEQAGVRFEVFNDGAHLVVEGRDGLIDFWPGTGKFVVRHGGLTGRGVSKVLKLCKTGEREK